MDQYEFIRTAHRSYGKNISEYDFTGSELTVRRYVRLAYLEFGLDPASRAFIPCEPDVGREAEVDWGTATGKFKV